MTAPTPVTDGTTPPAEAVEAELARHRPSRWRSFTNDVEILRCCGQDFGNATRRATRGEDERTWAAWSAHVTVAVVAALDLPGREREAAAKAQLAILRGTADGWAKQMDYAERVGGPVYRKGWEDAIRALREGADRASALLEGHQP